QRHTRTVRAWLTHALDLFGRPSKGFYSALADCATDEAEAEKLRWLTTPEGAVEFRDRVADTVTYADLLLEFGSARPSFLRLVDLIAPIKPRHYSIASSAKMHPGSVHLCVVAVEWRDSRGRCRTGQCTRFLNALSAGDSVVVSVKPSVMKLPPLDSQPVIMAGLGTGMAPFRAFIEERAVRKMQGADVGPMTLYFGSRHRAMEYLYGEELEAYHADGLLTNLRLAFSRDQKEKVYIQHRMRQDAELLASQMLSQEGAFYLCGPTWPTGDVKDAMVNAFTTLGGVKPSEANKVIEELKEDERYILEDSTAHPMRQGTGSDHGSGEPANPYSQPPQHLQHPIPHISMAMNAMQMGGPQRYAQNPASMPMSMPPMHMPGSMPAMAVHQQRMPRPKIRHPNRPPCLKPSKTLYIRNLNEKKKPPVLVAALRALFETYGTVLDIRARHSVRMRGQAFIVFKNIEDAERAHSEVQGFMLFGKPMFIEFSRMPSDATVIDEDGDIDAFKKHRVELRDTREKEAQDQLLAPPVPVPVSMSQALPPGVEIPNHILFLQGLPADIVVSEIETAFAPFDGLVEVRWVSVKPDVAFVEFKTEMQAAMAKTSLGSQLSLREGAGPLPMEAVSKLSPLPGAAPGESVSGGIASMHATGSPSTSGFAEGPSLLYRYTTRILEIRSLATISIDLSEALATLSSTQLESDPEEELEITHYSVVCFGFSGGRAMIGNLSIGVDGAQITAVEKVGLEGHKSDVVSSLSCKLPGSHDRSLVFLGLASGHVAVVEYFSYGINRKHVVGVVPVEDPRLGPASRLSAKLASNSRVVLAVGHSTANAALIDSGSALSAAAVHMVSLKGDGRAPLSMDAALINAAPMQAFPDSQYGLDRGSRNFAVPEAEIVDLAVVEVGTKASQPVIYVAALANALVGSSGADRGAAIDGLSGAGTGAPSHLFNAWVLSRDSMKLSSALLHDATTSGPAIAMQISGAASLVDVVASKQVLFGDALAEGLPETDAVADSAPHDGGLSELAKYIDFDKSFAYSDRVRSALMEQRRRMDGELFIDLLLQMAGAADNSASVVYPPKRPADVCSFIRGISSSALDDLKQRCIIYYLILDLSAPALVSDGGIYAESGRDATSQSELAARYACESFIPRHFEYLMRGYWLMDHAQTAVGISFLADSSVVADWAPKILRTAVSAGCYAEADAFLNSATALMQPRLDEQLSEAPVVMDVLLHCDFDRAFFFQRLHGVSSGLRDALLTQIFAFSLSSHAQRHAVDRLATLPLDAVEESALERYCTLPSAAAHARDFLALHFVNRGRYADAIRLFRQTARLETNVSSSSPMHKRKIEERLAMVQNLMLLLPAAQRWVIDELESLPSPESGTGIDETPVLAIGSAKAESLSRDP
ncbi:sulfite reductase [NADPH] flavoprotein component, partial [Coemansia sp. RSA 2598]